MSHRAVQWALDHAAIPADAKRPSAAAMHAVLVRLARHADEEGRNAWPSAATIAARTYLSVRTVQMCLDRLAGLGLIREGDQGVVAAAVHRADRRPTNWDLAMNGVHPVHPVGESDANPVHPVSSGVHPVHPDSPEQTSSAFTQTEDGVHSVLLGTGDGVHSVRERGAPSAPKAVLKEERTTTTAATRARANTTRPGPPARQLAAELNATATSSGGYGLVSDWNRTQTPPLRAAALRPLAKHIDTLLAEGADRDLLHDALNAWVLREGSRPGLLPHLYDDAVKAARAAQQAAGAPGATVVPFGRSRRPQATGGRAEKAYDALAVGAAMDDRDGTDLTPADGRAGQIFDDLFDSMYGG